MNSHDLKRILKGINIFEGMNENLLDEITPILKPMKCTAGETIIREGDPGEAMYIIKSGAVKITRADEEGDEIFISLLAGGTYFGEFSLIDNLTRSASVTAIEESEIFQLDKKDFDVLLAKNLDLALLFYKNCLKETFARFRTALANITFSQHTLREKTAELELINRDLSVAQQIQSVFINSDIMEENRQIHPRIRHEFIYHPCIEVGGDFMNIVKLDDDLISVIIADVEGHGVTAALATGILKSAFSILVEEYGRKPALLMTKLNQHFCKVLSRKLFATSYYALIDFTKGKITTAKAGHHHPLFWKMSQNSFLHIENSGPGFGLLEEAQYEESEYEFEANDRLIFFTDGIVEQMNTNHEMYGHKRLKQVVESLIKVEENEIARKIYNDVIQYAQGAQVEDDITLLVIEFL
ncbi:MAG: SpoIIE family protein phosphatase [Spirochaetes bacterium]|nr:SpoIIE family protein phosphatase [Spirochaetota bacterium]